MNPDVERLQNLSEAPLDQFDNRAPQASDSPTISFPSSKTGPLRASHFAPKPASDFIAEGSEEQVDWVLEDYLPRGGLVLWVAKPKMGKSTLLFHTATAIATGETFLGREVSPGRVLILAVEEHPRDVRRRLHALGGAHVSTLWVQAGMGLTPSTMFYEELTRFVVDQQIDLVILDTLSSFWDVHDENDAVAVTKAVMPFLRLARATDVCVVLIHHARKSEGSHGDEIRGSSALFSLVDIALVMKPHDMPTQRRLYARSRYPDTPAEVIVELCEGHYVLRGDPKEMDRAARREKIKDALSDIPQRAKAICQDAGVGTRDGERLLSWLADHDQAIRTGDGKKGSPYLYQQCDARTPSLLRDGNRMDEPIDPDGIDPYPPVHA